MRVLNAAQSTLAYLGVLAGHEHTFDAVADPLLAAFVRRMLVEESVPTLAAGARHRRRSPMSSRASPGCATPRSATATTRSPPTARRRSSQRLLNPLRERLRRGEAARCLPVAVAAWMAYLVRASDRFGAPGRPTTRRPTAIAAIADRDRRRHCGADGRRSSRIDAIFAPAPRRRCRLPRRASTAALAGLLSRPSAAYLEAMCRSGRRRLKRRAKRLVRTGGERHEARHCSPRRFRTRRSPRSPTGRARPASRRWRSPAGRSRPGRPAAMPAPATSTSPTSRRREASEIVAALAEKGLADLRRSATIPNPLHPDPHHRETVIAHLKKVIVAAAAMGVPAGQHLLRRRRREARRRQLAGRAQGLARHHRPCRATTASSSPSRTAR